MVKQKNYHKVTTIMCVMVMLILMINCCLATGESLMGGHLDNQETTFPEEEIDTGLHYRIANHVPFAFNGGQPFSLEKDPVTGQIDFDKAPPLKALNYTGSYETDEDDQMSKESDNVKANDNDDDDDNDDNDNNNDTLELLMNDELSSDDETRDDEQQIPNEINPYSPSFHDFLNLPVRYTNHEKYTNDKYPLISSSYANTKVQGGSMNYNAYTINHKNYYHSGGKASTSQSYSMTRRPYVSRTTTTKKPTTTITTKKPTTTTTTTKKPTTTTSTTTTKPITTQSTTTSTTKRPTTTESITTWKPTKVDRYDVDYEEEVMLPIEKMQNSPNIPDQVFGSLDANAYEDNYEDYAPLETMPTTMSTTPSTTTTSTTTSTPQTSMPLDPVRINAPSNLGGMQRPDYSTQPLNSPITHPGYAGLILESSSNVIVPPDQDTVSFVLGNKQNVQGTFYAHGSAMPESPYGEIAPRPAEADQHSHDHSIGRPPMGTIVSPYANQLPPDNNDNNSQKWWFNSEQSEKSQSVAEKTKDDKISVGAGYRVVFPTDAPASGAPDTSNTINATTASTVQDGPSILSEILTPPAVDGPIRPSPGQRPHFYPHHHYHQRPEMPPRVQRPPLGPANNGYKMRPPPTLDVNLPNILPQFRPNVKNPQRRGGEAIGTMIVPNPPKYTHRVSMRPPPPPPPHRVPARRPTVVSHLQRLNPPPPPPPPVHSLRLPTPAALIAGPDSRGQGTDNISKEIPNRRNIIGGEGQIDERNRLTVGSQILKSRLDDGDLEKLNSEAPAVPPRAPLFPKRKTGNSSVATLQMIQQHRVQPGDIIEVNGESAGDNDNKQADRRTDEPPVYVVYPVKGTIDIRPDAEDHSEKEQLNESVVIGTHGPQRPLPPDTLAQQDQEDNDDDDKQDEGLIIPPRPAVQLASDFPYPPAIPDPSLYLSQIQEKPLLVPNEHQQNESFDDKDFPVNNQHDRDTSINIIPYLQDRQSFPLKTNVISTTLQLFGSQSSGSSSSTTGSTATPIAYVYTPTTRAPLRRQSESFERNPILLPSQQPSSSSSSAPSPQNFMAPFVASISAEMPSKNGWSVVTGGPFTPKQEISDKIDKNDEETPTVNSTDIKERTVSTTQAPVSTENNNDDDNKNKELQINTDFDEENFKPQLFGGFQPIFEFPTDSEEMPSDIEHTGTVTIMEKPRSAKDAGP